MKMYYYLVIIVGLMIFLNIAGVNTTTGYVLNYLDIVDNPQNLQNSNIYALIVGIFLAAITGGVVIGLFTKTSPESYLIAPLAGVLVLFVGDMISIVSYVNSLGVAWISYIVLMIMGTLSFGYVVSVLDWWRGID